MVVLLVLLPVVRVRVVWVVVRRGSTGRAGASTSKRLPAAGSATLAPYTGRCWCRFVLATAAADAGDSATHSSCVCAGVCSTHAPSPGFTLAAAVPPAAPRGPCSVRCGRVGVRLCTSDDAAGDVLRGSTAAAAAVLAARLWWWWWCLCLCCCCGCC